MDDFKPILDSMDNTFGAIDEPSEDDSSIHITIENGNVWTIDAIGYDNDGQMLHAFEWLEFSEEAIEELIIENGLTEEEAAEARELVGERPLLQRGLIPLDRVMSIQTDIPKQLSSNGPNVEV